MLPSAFWERTFQSSLISVGVANRFCPRSRIRSMFLRSSPLDITSGDALSQCSRFLLTWHKHAC